MSLRFTFIAIALAAVLILSTIRSSFYHFECPECGEHFQVGLLRYLYISGVLLGKHRRTSLFGAYEVTCPKCRRMNLLVLKRGRGRE